MQLCKSERERCERFNSHEVSDLNSKNFSFHVKEKKKEKEKGKTMRK